MMYRLGQKCTVVKTVILPDSIERLKKMYNPKVLVHEKPRSLNFHRM